MFLSPHMPPDFKHFYLDPSATKTVAIQWVPLYLVSTEGSRKIVYRCGRLSMCKHILCIYGRTLIAFSPCQNGSISSTLIIFFKEFALVVQLEEKWVYEAYTSETGFKTYIYWNKYSRAKVEQIGCTHWSLEKWEMILWKHMWWVARHGKCWESRARITGHLFETERRKKLFSQNILSLWIPCTKCWDRMMFNQ